MYKVVVGGSYRVAGYLNCSLIWTVISDNDVSCAAASHNYRMDVFVFGFVVEVE